MLPPRFAGNGTNTMPRTILMLLSPRKICHGLIWAGCILAGLAMALPLLVTQPLTGISAENFVIHQHRAYFQVTGIRHGHQRKLAISRQQYRQVKRIGEMGTMGVVAGIGLCTMGYALLLIRSARQQRRLRLAQIGALTRRR